MNYPHLSLDQIAIDPELVRRLPRKLAYYHRVLPLAADDEQISIAMAYPDNQLVLEILETFLGTSIVPVHAHSSEIQTALDQVWRLIKKSEPHILSWGASNQQAERAYAASQALGSIFGARITDLRSNDLDTIVGFTQQDTYTFAVVSDLLETGDFIHKVATPTLLMYGNPVLPFRRIMLSLRGHAPDLSALDWLIPLAKAGQAETTVLAVTSSSMSAISARRRSQSSLATLLDPDQEPAQHVTECTDQLVAAGIHGYLKLCQGDPVTQIVTEFSKGQYTLLVIVSEAHGDFVQEVLTAIRGRQDPYAVLVVKPMLA